MVSVIKQLDDITANQIAAGEVVERPASVIKELVENAIDAKATKIKVEVEDGGVKLMRVTDNGQGMCRDDAVLCLQRHATSKISSSEDLGAIKTLGFRGEALPSISSVSLMKISTCDNEEHQGWYLTVKGGVIEDMTEKGMQKGTQIEVSGLFYNTPARLKFLKSKTTEYSHIVSLVSEYALCYPNIRFELVKDGKQTLISSPNGNRMNAVAAVLGLDTAKNLVPFEAEDSMSKVYGYVSKSDFVRSSRKDEYLFVNGRSVKNRNILFAVELIFKNLLGPGKYPVCLVFVDLDEKLVDVNVHPTKSEIKFANERAVYSLLYKSVQEAVMGGGGMHAMTPSDLNPGISSHKGENIRVSGKEVLQNNANELLSEETYVKGTAGNTVSSESKNNIQGKRGDFSAFESNLRGQEIPENNPFSELRPEIKTDTPKEKVYDPFDWSSDSEIHGIEETPTENMFSSRSGVDLSAVKVISQYKNTYIICECADGIVFIDQHVAHERVLYNRMIKQDYSHNYINPLLIPQNVTFTGVETAFITEKLEEIKQTGYDLEPFGNNTFLLRGVPAEIKEKDSIKVLREIVEEICEMKGEKKIVVRPEQILISASCKKAIKAGQPMSMPEMQNLVKELLKTDNPFTCPHNRPIIVSISDYDLYRKFKRI